MKRNGIVCLDMEGVLIPEIWTALAQKFNIEKLFLTTRDVKNYDELMKLRIGILKKNKITIDGILELIGTLKLLDGASGFMTELRKRTQVLLISDTFMQFIRQFLAQLNYPTVLCNRLEIDADGYLVRHLMRSNKGKGSMVKALHDEGYKVAAVGDSYNDIAMLQEAEIGVLFNAPANIKADYPQILNTSSYDQLLEYIRDMLEW